MKTQNTILSTLAAALAIGCLSQAAHAADPVPPSPLPTSVVDFADLNVAAPKGADRLYLRIVAAAQHVCGADEHPRSLGEQVRVKVCIDQSIERAVAKVDQPALTALLAAKTGHSVPTAVLANRR